MQLLFCRIIYFPQIPQMTADSSIQDLRKSARSAEYCLELLLLLCGFDRCKGSVLMLLLVEVIGKRDRKRPCWLYPANHSEKVLQALASN